MDFCKEFKIQSDALQVVDEEDLARLEVALQNMQGTCLEAADQISTAVKGELRALCSEAPLITALEEATTPSAAARIHLLCGKDDQKIAPASGSETPSGYVDDRWSSD